MGESTETDQMLVDLAQSVIFFGTGILFGYHAFGKKNAWWKKKSKKRTVTEVTEDSEFESDEEVSVNALIASYLALSTIFENKLTCNRIQAKHFVIE